MVRTILQVGCTLLAMAQGFRFSHAQEDGDKEQLTSLWNDLESPDGLRALAAIKALGVMPDKVLPLVREQLRTYPAIDQANVNRWIADLDDDRFEVRERATAELVKLGERAELGLRKALASDPSVEIRRRGEKLLRLMDASSARSGRLRAVRVVYLLEEIADPNAIKLLRTLAKGPADDQRTLDARSALDRLASHPKGRVENPQRESSLPEMDILVDEPNKYIKDPNAPLRKGAARFRVRKLEPLGSVTKITARDALTYNGFAMEYVLTAETDSARLKGKALSDRELRDVQITYNDDLLRAKGLSEKDLEQHVQLLHRPEHRVGWHCTVIPGGEMLDFSDPMKKLIILGDKARPRMEQCLADPRIESEAALVLGAIGNERTITLLIDAYPTTEARARGKSFDDAATAKAVYFTFALTYLTAQPIGRSRRGADCDAGNRGLWQEWWKAERGVFRVPQQKPNATWVPEYPLLSEEWA